MRFFVPSPYTPSSSSIPDGYLISVSLSFRRSPENLIQTKALSIKLSNPTNYPFSRSFRLMLMRPISAGTLPGGVNLFSSPPPKPRINDPYAPKPPPFPPIPTRKKRPPPPNHNLNHKPDANRVLKSTHYRTKYYKPVTDGTVIPADADRAVIVGESGVSYLLPGAPFQFQFSYSETPKVKPIAFREPAFLPFAPPTMPRPWTGKAPLKSKKEKELKRQKRVRLVSGDFNSFVEGEGGGKVMEMERDVKSLGEYHDDPRCREEILGKPLTTAEVRALVKPFLSRNRQVNLGRDGLTHNMLDLIHSHWRRSKICKVRCRGVPTVDMYNVCHHLEKRTGGKIIYQAGGVLYLFRGRNYDPRTRPRYPVMLWKPSAPVYPKLIQEAPEGLTKVEAEKMRAEGKKLLPICKLAKNGIYLNLVKDVRDAFEFSPLVKIDCRGLEPSDYKKIGAKLKDLVPCVLLSFDDEQILAWRGKDWKSTSTEKSTNSNSSALLGISGKSRQPLEEKGNATPRMLLLWKEAIATKKALLLTDLTLCPDALLEKVEEFESATQASEHSYRAVILSHGEDSSGTDVSYSDEYHNSANVLVDDDLESAVTFDLMPVDILARRLSQD